MASTTETAVCPDCDHRRGAQSPPDPIEWFRVRVLHGTPRPAECFADPGDSGWGDVCGCRNPFHGE